MKAAVVHEAGGPEVLKIEDRPIPEVAEGWVRIRVRAFGLNRSEMFTRQGHSPDVQFPRILGIEAVGEVDADPSGAFAEGQTVATAMGGMGRDFDGGYAEFTCVPIGQVMALDSTLDWADLGALPEMVQTAHGALSRALRLKARETLLIRGGTTSVGLTASILATGAGADVISTTRQMYRGEMLLEHGAIKAIVDQGEIANTIRESYPDGVDKVLELIGTTTLLDSLKATKRGGIVAMTGIVGGEWTLDGFNPMEAIPTGVCLTSYGGDDADFMATPLQTLIKAIEADQVRIPKGPVFTLDQIVEAHEVMEANEAKGKIVVVT